MKHERDDQLVTLMLQASPLHDPNHWKKKFRELVNTTLQKNALEQLGKLLSTEQVLELIDWAIAKNNSSSQDKLNALFLHIPQSIFCELLLCATQEQINFLKRDSAIEIVQHHLSLLSHELRNRFEQFCYSIVAEEKRLNKLDISELGVEAIQSLSYLLSDLSHQGRIIVDTASCALALAWNTNRADLIQELSKTKELCHRSLSKHVGNPRSEETSPTGLWLLLENRLNSVFSDVDTKGEIVYMKDTDFALEALVKFSVWHLRDYYEIGLLSETEGEISIQHKNNLFSLAEKNLAKLGFKNLGDLKKANIYSRQALVDYINIHKARSHSKNSKPQNQ